MTTIKTIVKHNVRTTWSEHQGQNSISDPDQNLGFTCIFNQVCKNKTAQACVSAMVKKRIEIARDLSDL